MEVGSLCAGVTSKLSDNLCIQETDDWIRLLCLCVVVVLTAIVSPLSQMNTIPMLIESTIVI